jgi:hypothetical protein
MWITNSERENRREWWNHHINIAPTIWFFSFLIYPLLSHKVVPPWVNFLQTVTHPSLNVLMCFTSTICHYVHVIIHYILIIYYQNLHFFGVFLSILVINPIVIASVITSLCEYNYISSLFFFFYHCEVTSYFVFWFDFLFFNCFFL